MTAQESDWIIIVAKLIATTLIILVAFVAIGINLLQNNYTGAIFDCLMIIIMQLWLLIGESK